MSFLELFGGNLVVLGLVGGLFTAILNMVGVTPVFFLRRVSQKAIDVGLGFGAGVMLAASFTSLIVPGFEVGGVPPVLLGIALGAIAVSVGDRLLPHMHFIIGREGLQVDSIKAIWLFVLAITLHNMPEGLAVGVGFGSGDITAGITLMIAIGLQNIPEGLSVALSLMATGRYSRSRSYFAGVISGFVEPPLALIGAWAVVAGRAILPYAMGFAAGAMIFVISDEIIPETHRPGSERWATYGLIVGLITMLALDGLLG